MSDCFVKIVSKSGLVYKFYLNFNECQKTQNRDFLFEKNAMIIHQEQHLFTFWSLSPNSPPNNLRLLYLFWVFFWNKQDKFHSLLKKNVRGGGDLFDFLKAQVAFTPISNSAVIFNTFIYWIDVNNRLERLFNMRNGLVWLQHLITWCTGLLWWSLFFFLNLNCYDGFVGVGWECITWPILTFTSHPNHWCHPRS